MKAGFRYSVAGALTLCLIGAGASASFADDFNGDSGDGYDDEFEEDFDDDLDADLDESDDGADGVDEAQPAEENGDGKALTLGEGDLKVRGVGEVNLSSDVVGEPISIAPDIYFGVTDEFTVGLVHSGIAERGFFGGVGRSLCLTGEDEGCPEVYPNVGLSGALSIIEDDVSIAAELGLFALNFGDGFFSDPALIQAKLGARGAWVDDPIQVVFEPNVFVALTERDEDIGGLHGDILNIPVAAYFSATDELSVGAQAGFTGNLDGLGDTWAVPLSAVAHFAIDDRVGLGGSFTFPQLIAEEDTADLRSLNIFASFRL